MSPPVLVGGLRFVPSPGGACGEGLLQNPATGVVARIGATEWKVLQRFDGRDLEIVRDRLRRECDFAFAPGELEQFAHAARHAGLLQGQTSGAQRTTGLCWHVPLCNPETAFAWLADRASRLFAPASVALGALVVGMATASVWLAAPMPAEHSASWWQLAVFVWLFNVVSILHECGHGVALHFYGGGAREIGICFILGWPCWYCDITESYVLPRKRQRMAVLLAGPFVQAVACGLIVLVGLTVAPEATAVRRSAMLLGAFSIVNLFPLVPSDGYYLLAELVDMPNLRTYAWQWLTSARARRRMRGERSRGERATIAAFAVTSGVFVAILVVRMLTAIAGVVGGARPLSARTAIAAIALTLMTCALVRVLRARCRIRA